MRSEVNLNEYAPLGSDIYYVLRQVPSDKRPAYLAIHAFATELYKISESYREVKIAQQKLAWWCDEIKRLYQGVPTHPITKALSPDLKLYDLKEVEFLAMLEGAMLTTTTQIFETESELRQHYQHLGGIAAALKAKVLVPCALKKSEFSSRFVILRKIAQQFLRRIQSLITCSKAALTNTIDKSSAEINKTIHQLGIIQETLRHIIDLPKFLQRQYLYLPLSAFQQQNIDPQPILQGKNLASLKPLLQDELNQAPNQGD